ncbi:MAG: YicC/YloC family endoribonuclease [Pseudomonadota bacterium]
MLLSMTAFGSAQRDFSEGTVSVELRSVNHRYLDVSVRAPEELRALDNRIRQQVAKRLARGKVECAMRFERANAIDPTAAIYDTALARQVVKAMRDIAKDTGREDTFHPDPARVLAWPGVLSGSQVDLDALQQTALETLGDALDAAVAHRTREGESIAEHLAARVREIDAIVSRLRARRPALLAHQAERWLARLDELATDVDPGRIEQELVIAAQKLDIDEELDRLATHVKEVERVLAKAAPAGRRLDFLMQEFNREANTVASKSADSETTALAVDLKVLIEQMREQVQNVE